MIVRHQQEAIHLSINGFDAIEVRLGDFDCRSFFLDQLFVQFPNGCHENCPLTSSTDARSSLLV